jgi:hypothetical protein
MALKKLLFYGNDASQQHGSNLRAIHPPNPQGNIPSREKRKHNILDYSSENFKHKNNNIYLVR